MKDSKKGIISAAIENVKLVDAGVKNKYGSMDCAKPMTSSKDRVYYPNLYLDTKEAPMLSGSDVGEEVTLLVKAKVISHSLNEGLDRKNENFSLEIRKIGVVSTDKSKD